MATGPEHYREAEQLLDWARQAERGGDWERLYLAQAQIHATLALAAATAMNDFEGGMGRVDHCGWLDVASADWCVKHQRTLNGEGKCRQCVDHCATEARGFEVGDVVNVSDPGHEYFGVRATVAVTCDSGWLAIETGRNNTPLALPASSLMHHAAFVAQMDAAEQQAAKDPEPTDEPPVMDAAAYVASLFDGCSDAQLAGDACADCGGDLTAVGIRSRSVIGGPLFVHADVALCVEDGAR